MTLLRNPRARRLHAAAASLALLIMLSGCTLRDLSLALRCPTADRQTGNGTTSVVQASDIHTGSPLMDQALAWAFATAADDTHGYSQLRRLGPDYDCSSYVAAALNTAGIGVAPTMSTYTEDAQLASHGFSVVQGANLATGEGLKAGDILIRHGSGEHTEFYVGKLHTIGAHASETGGIDGKPGDQTGEEISQVPFTGGWSIAYRYTGNNQPDITLPVTHPTSPSSGSSRYTVRFAACTTSPTSADPTGGSGVHAAADQAKQVAQQLMRQRYPTWAEHDYRALVQLWERESGWQWNATNPSSGAYGIPQALPASKLASAGADWKDNAATQITWGLDYIHSRYGTPQAAWAFWQIHHWY